MRVLECCVVMTQLIVAAIMFSEGRPSTCRGNEGRRLCRSRLIINWIYIGENNACDYTLYRKEQAIHVRVKYPYPKGYLVQCITALAQTTLRKVSHINGGVATHVHDISASLDISNLTFLAHYTQHLFISHIGA